MTACLPRGEAADAEVFRHSSADMYLPEDRSATSWALEKAALMQVEVPDEYDSIGKVKATSVASKPEQCRTLEELEHDIMQLE